MAIKIEVPQSKLLDKLITIYILVSLPIVLLIILATLFLTFTALTLKVSVENFSANLLKIESVQKELELRTIIASQAAQSCNEQKQVSYSCGNGTYTNISF